MMSENGPGSGDGLPEERDIELASGKYLLYRGKVVPARTFTEWATSPGYRNVEFHGDGPPPDAPVNWSQIDVTLLSCPVTNILIESCGDTGTFPGSWRRRLFKYGAALRVSTVFLGIDLSHAGGEPVLFDTIASVECIAGGLWWMSWIFWDRSSAMRSLRLNEQWRYHLHDEAKEGHWSAVDYICDMLNADIVTDD